jgi:phosphatidylglycerophosphate synthase
MARENPEKEHAMESGDYRSLSATSALWFAMLGGPLATALVTGINYAMITKACEDESVGWLYVVNIAAFLIGLAAFVTAYRLWQRMGGGQPSHKFGVVHRGKFMCIVGMMSSSLAMLGVLMELYPIIVMGPCTGS